MAIEADRALQLAAPYVAHQDGRRQVIVSGLSVRSYDFETGAPLWEAAGLGENTIPQPVQHEDLVFAMSGHTVKMLLAIRLGRKGDLTGTDAIAWSTPRGVPYTPSPLLHEGRLYVLTDSGLLSVFDAATGKPHYQQALELQGVARGRQRQAVPGQRGGRRRGRQTGCYLRGAGDQHDGRAVLHRIPGHRRWRHLPAQPDPPVQDRRRRRLMRGTDVQVPMPKLWRRARGDSCVWMGLPDPVSRGPGEREAKALRPLPRTRVSSITRCSSSVAVLKFP